ncbi:MAG: hypothetical protein BM564_01565 [Bacteroidetes bacterium MedPE-SWsnd-G2]|nr:MAG: hypothetical protein BM564_01565 [Bacteroidetes bacterium MedPE-SWsnd-G2]
MRLKLVVSCLFLFFMLSCESDSKDQQQTSVTKQDVNSSKITAKDIAALKYVDIDLGTAAKQAISDWQNFIEFRNQLTFLKSGDLSFFQGDEAVLIEFLVELRKDLPKSLDTQIIHVRLTVLSTRVLELNGNLVLENLDKKVLLESIRDLLESNSNLNLQIDKKLEFDQNNIFKPE